MSMMLFFDVGETLASEERWLGSWADWLQVSRATFFAALGALIEARRPHQEVFALFRPGIDLEAEREKRRALGIEDHFIADDLYPDALPTLRWAKEAGHRIGIAGNNTANTEAFARGLGLADVVGSSQRWGAAKPDPPSSSVSSPRPAARRPRSSISATASTMTCCPRLTPVSRRSTSRAARGARCRRAGRRERACAASGRSPNCRRCLPRADPFLPAAKRSCDRDHRSPFRNHPSLDRRGLTAVA